jgi:hypothetical protein
LSYSSIPPLPAYVSADTLKTQPFIPVPDQDCLLAELDRGLSIAIKPVRRGVATEQRRKRNPELDISLIPEVMRIGHE